MERGFNMYVFNNGIAGGWEGDKKIFLRNKEEWNYFRNILEVTSKDLMRKFNTNSWYGNKYKIDKKILRKNFCPTKILNGNIYKLKIYWKSKDV